MFLKIRPKIINDIYCQFWIDSEFEFNLEAKRSCNSYTTAIQQVIPKYEEMGMNVSLEIFKFLLVRAKNGMDLKSEVNHIAQYIMPEKYAFKLLDLFEKYRVFI